MAKKLADMLTELETAAAKVADAAAKRDAAKAAYEASEIVLATAYRGADTLKQEFKGAIETLIGDGRTRS